MLIKPNIIKVRQDDGTFSELQNLMVGEQDIVPAEKVDGLSKVAISGHYKDLEGAPDPKDLIVDAGIEVGTEEPERTSIDVWIDTNQGQTTYRIPEVKDNLINEQDTWSSQKIESSKLGVEYEELKSGHNIQWHGNEKNLLTYGSGKFVLVRSNKIVYTTNGITWSDVYSLSPYISTDIIYGNGKFICVNGHNIAYYSIDAITWEQVELPIEASNITYGNRMFVAKNESEGIVSVAYSTNGITWTTATPNITGSDFKLTYCKDRFILYSTSTTNLYYSTNGSTWTRIEKPNACLHMVYGNGKFLAIGDNNTISYSENFTTWIESGYSLPSSTAIYDVVVYSDGRFVALARGSFGAYSDDGLIWNAVHVTSSSPTDGWRDICYGQGKFMAIDNSDKIVYSEDGITWKNKCPVLSQNDKNVTKDVKSALDINTNYSIGEVKTGDTWIDGKPIYRFIWQGSTSLKKAQGVLCRLPEGHFDTVFTLRGMFKRTTDNNWFAIPNGYYGGTGWTVNLRTDIATDGPDGILVGFGEEYTDSNRPIILIAEYTKK